MNNIGMMFLIIVSSMMLGCGGGGSSGSGGSSPDLGGAVITPIDTDLTLDEDDIDNVNNSGGAIVGEAHECLDEAYGELGGCWSATTGSEGCSVSQGEGDFWLSVNIDFEESTAEEEKVLDIAGYFYDNDTCSGDPRIVKRFSNLSLFYIVGEDLGEDLSGFGAISPKYGLTVRSELNDKPFSEAGSAFVVVSNGGTEEICFSPSFKITDTGFSLAAEDSTEIDFDNCLVRFTH
ncbi:hypothetical protein [Hahella ganghwensis]|uniref:hypothetical protein n=1 Tax=Hahella ganghwensis TaxID=286420 RepID=UPI00035F7FAB|nr:hypothetical protein [Hahella ganghwensis]